ncbi:MAG: hypothetical protein IPK52_18100 [Chloroflexi bacterium]|nr:hypothetical protein [Chloroflexota bacterium]
MHLLTRELWHGLHHALPRHPLLWYPLRHQDAARETPTFWLEFVPTILLMIAVIMSLVLWVVYGISPLTMVLLLMLLMDTYAGVIVTRGVTTSMQRARERGLLELMGVTPSGKMGAVWALMTRYLRRDQMLAGLHQAAAWLHATWLFGLLPYAALVFVAFCSSTSFNQTEFAQIFNQPLSLLNGVCLFGIMIMDYLGALVSGALVGMIVPSIPGMRSESVYLAPLGFIALQAVNYALVLAMHVAANAVLGVPGWLSGWTSSLTFMLAFVVVREGSLWVLCIVLARRMNTSVQDVLTIHRRSL